MDGWMHGWMDGCMDGFMDGWIDEWMHACMHACMHGWMPGWMDGWMDGWMAGWLDGWMNGWMDGWMTSLQCPTLRLHVYKYYLRWCLKYTERTHFGMLGGPHGKLNKSIVKYMLQIITCVSMYSCIYTCPYFVYLADAPTRAS